MLRKLGNYNLFLVANSLASLANGLFAPFWIVFIQDFGGSFEQFGFSVGIMTLASAITSYFAGKHSDQLGRKIFLITSGLLMAAITFAYTIITSIWHLYALQIFTGVTGAMGGTIGAAFLGDITKKQSRGADIGKYHAIISVASAIAMMAGGFIVGQSGFKMIFYITAGITFVSTLMLVYIKEN